MIGLIARVTGRIGPGLLGEVSVPANGGTMACLAYAADPADRVIEIGERVLIVDVAVPRTVYVTPMDAALRR